MASHNRSSLPNIVTPVPSKEGMWTLTPSEKAKTQGGSVHNNKENVPPQGMFVSQGISKPNKESEVSKSVIPSRFPLYDPMRSLSKAKDPVIAPPKPKSHLGKENPPNGFLGGGIGKHYHRTKPRAVFQPLQNNAIHSIRGVLQPVHHSSSGVKMEFLGRKQSQMPRTIVRQQPYRLFAEAARSSLQQTSIVPKIVSPPRIKSCKDPSPPDEAETLYAFGDLASYARKLRNIVKSRTPKAAQEAEDELRTMIQRYDACKTMIRPDGACFNAVIHAYAELGDAQAAQAVLLLMFSQFKQGNYQAKPNVRVYTNVLHAWRKTKSKEAPERCELILQNMHRLHQSGDLPDCEPDTFSYTVLFHCWAESNRDDAAQHAERLFRAMKSRYLKGQVKLRPDAIAYSNILNIFTKKEETHLRADSLLWEMVEDYLSGNKSAKPRIRNFNTVLAMFSKSKLEDAPDRAQSLIHRLIELEETKQVDVRPDHYSYSLLLKTWGTSKRPDGASQAVKNLLWMEELHTLGDAAARLDVIKYTTCISALAKRGYAERAEELLNKMRTDFLNGNYNAQPDSTIYEMVIASWCGNYAQSKVDSNRAAALLKQMWSLHSTNRFDKMRPSFNAYKLVICAMKKTKNPGKANDLLDELERKVACGKIDQGPTKQLYQTVMNAWYNSNHEDRKMRAYQLEVRIHRCFHSTSRK